MHVDIDRFAYFTVIRAVMHSENRKVFRREKELDGAPSMAGCVQVISDKSPISPAAASMKFIPLHMTL